MKYWGRLWILAFLAASLFLTGCSMTLHEQKETATDTGNITQLKFTGSKMKVVHDF